MRGIVLAGGTGSRLWPVTRGTSKQLLPIYDKPLVFFPIATLMQAGIRDIALITTAQDQSAFQRLLGNGNLIGINLTYLVQDEPLGIAHAFIVAEDFIGSDSVALILGDNLFHGAGFHEDLRKLTSVNGAQIFGYEVSDPERYGVVEFDKGGKVISLEEKPDHPKSRYAVPGLYFYDNSVIEIVRKLTPSKRGELEITAVNEVYRNSGILKVTIMGRGTAWLDTGTFDSLHDAGSFVRTLQDRQGLQIACLEEIAWENGWISNQALSDIAKNTKDQGLKNYLMRLVNRKD